MPKPKKPELKKPQSQSQSQSHPRPSPPPNWPPLRPLLPATDLRLTALVPDQIYLIRNFLPAGLCKTYSSFLSSLPLTTTPGKPKKDEAVRVNDRFQVEDARFAEMLWSGTAMKELVTRRLGKDEHEEYEEEGAGADGAHQREDVAELARRTWGGEVLGLNPNIRIYRYSTGQFFAQHCMWREGFWPVLLRWTDFVLTILTDDESNFLTFRPASSTKSTPARTTWTLLIYLTACNGGETVFYPEPTRADRNPEPISVAPEMGMALLHRHGDHCMLHEGKEVTAGEKWVLRSDLVVAR